MFMWDYSVCVQRTIKVVSAHKEQQLLMRREDIYQNDTIRHCQASWHLNPD